MGLGPDKDLTAANNDDVAARIAATELEMDPAKLREKYLEERDKRLSRGSRDYLSLTDHFPELDGDPFVAEPIRREAVVEEVDVCLAGGGFSTQMTAAKLLEYGVENFRIIEMAADFGGTWYWNRYPGIRCDIESYIYLPMIEEVGTVPTERYSTGREIFGHAQAIGRRFGLYEKALFQTKILEARWDDESSRWHITTDRGDLIKARFLVGATGWTRQPKLPDVPGIRDFTGKIIHSSRWDAAYTGGTGEEELNGLKGKTVALIGTGATGIQILPNVAKYAERVYLIQRTPAAVGARNNRPTDFQWFSGLKPGWQKERMDNFHAVISGGAYETDLVGDCWTKDAAPLFGTVTDIATDDPEATAIAMQDYDYRLMQSLRNRIDAIVKDPKAAAMLKPWYNLYCKRPLYADDYLEAFNNPGVRVVDTDGHGVERITKDGLIAGGQEYKVDCIIFASGFHFGGYTEKTASFSIIGKSGKTLVEHWKDGVHSVHGLLTNGFPNFQLVGTFAQAAASTNYITTSQEHANHAASIISSCLNNGTTYFEVTQEAEEKWNARMKDKAVDRQGFYQECTPGYLNNEGATGSPGPYGQVFGGGAAEYHRLLQQWRETDWKTQTVTKSDPAARAA